VSEEAIEREVERVALLMHAGFSAYYAQVYPDRTRPGPFAEMTDFQQAGHRAAARAIVTGATPDTAPTDGDCQPFIVEAK
jgi:hypothetical protein